MEEFYRAFKDGNIPVRWSERLYWGYGYPFFNFNYPSIYYLGVPLMAAGVSAAAAMKLETAGFFAVSGIVMYLYLARKVKPLYALLGAVLYLYAPYRMGNIYVRGSVAEAVSFVFPPLLLWGAESPSLWLALVIGLMGISHNISMLLLSGFYFGYLAILAVAQRNWRHFLKGAGVYILGILMAAFFIVPALYEKQWTFLDLTIARDYPDHFVYFQQFFDPRWGFGGSGPGAGDGMSLSLGLVQIGLALVALKSIKKNSLAIFCYLTIFVSVFFMLPVSKFLWDRVPLLPFVQFPWRFTMLTVPALAIAGSFVQTKNIVAVSLIGLTILSANYMWRRNQTEVVPVISGDAIPGSTTWAHEQATRWLVPKPDRVPAAKIENAAYQINLWKTNEHSYVINGSGQITENTMYYPGWKVFVDGVEQPVNYDDGKINYTVSAGQHQIKAVFTETPLRKSLDLLSLGTFGLVVLGLLFRYVVPKVAAKH